MSKRSGNPAKRAWDPIVVTDAINPRTPMAKAFFETEGRQHHYKYRDPKRAVGCKAFGNRIYDGLALIFEDGSMHLSFKRKDRAAVRDWRHVQAIKNSVAGPDREAVEIFPAERNLLDASNEYHLWVLPPGLECPFGLEGRGVGEAVDYMDHASYRQGGRPGARQRDWEEGIPTGKGIPEPGTVPTLPQTIFSTEKGDEQ